MFNDKDIAQIDNKGQNEEGVLKQINHFKAGFPFINLVAPAIKDNGVMVFDEAEVKEYASFYDQEYKERDIIKFVPASGAASRMFKSLFNFIEKCDKPNFDLVKEFEDKSFNSIFYFFDNIQKFAFYEELKKTMNKNGEDLDKCMTEKQFKTILEFLLLDKGLGYASKPKGLLAFHNYKDVPRFAVEEHLVEAAVYARDKNDIAKIHFTVSPEHLSKFEEKVNASKGRYEEQYGVRFEVSYSIQKPSTDTIAVNPDNTPFRETNGDLLFRPGGHGALIENVNDLKGDIVFIKNIDNVVPDNIKFETFLYKKALAGYLIKLENQLVEYLELLDEGNITKDQIEDLKIFATDKLNVKIDKDVLTTLDEIEVIDYLYNALNRPLRICGMVKNEGEPGGGPYWVKDEEDDISLQIVESSQMDLSKKDQKAMVSNATHFNPVDLICSVRDYNGESFDLSDFVDPQTGFISEKSKDGKDLKAQELPGLWNGAMAKWITIFAETPIITFNPVKTVNDLLRDQHQA